MIKLSDYFMMRYGGKVAKLSLDGGFTCPNRIGGSGCHFCSSHGSGDFAGVVQVREDHGVLRSSEQSSAAGPGTLLAQAEAQMRLHQKKWKPSALAGYLAYFQSYTGTFADAAYLRALYREALAIPGVLGFAVATRPDCLGEDALEVLCEEGLRDALFWVELGLQTAHDATRDALGVGYSAAEFLQAMDALSRRGIRAVVHVIVGLPGETRDDFRETIRFVAKQKPFGVKLHMLNIVKGSRLEARHSPEEWERQLLTLDEYVDWVAEALRMLPPETVIHRLTGDADHSALLAPAWIKRKWEVLNAIDRALELR